MVDTLIRKVPEETKRRPRQRAKRHGVSLEAELRAALEVLARGERPASDDDQPLGTWLVKLTRPGVDLDESSSWMHRARR